MRAHVDPAVDGQATSIVLTGEMPLLGAGKILRFAQDDDEGRARQCKSTTAWWQCAYLWWRRGGAMVAFAAHQWCR
jgi:hypothetical protein